MNQTEHASELRDLNRRNRKLWQIHQQHFDQELERCEQTTDGALAAAYERVKPRAQLEEAQHEAHHQKQEKIAERAKAEQLAAQAQVAEAQVAAAEEQREQLSGKLSAAQYEADEQKRQKNTLLEYRSALRRAIGAALLRNSETPNLQICAALDDDGALAREDRMSWVEKYKAEKGSGSLHTTISQVRRDLFGKRT